ncbi:SWIM-type domain-containing protein [Citrus sinensis]|uniref:SWIM-type domain-containing protein n=1 Tax=Citrus sinensis TaxID=2711 RepID=A0ACB8NAA8_CITSI|nr:SWIM-type domain-containing protein [Citrus sinensis]
MSLQQYYSPIYDNYDNIDDNDITLQDVGEEVFPITTSLEQQYSPYHNNDFQDNDDIHDETNGDNVCAEPSNSMRGTHFNNAGDDGRAGPSNILSFQHEDDCDSDDISVGKLFTEKNEFILQLRKVAFRDKFDFKIARSTTTRFEAHCCSKSCKWRIRATRSSNEQNVHWVVQRIDNVHTCHNEVLVDGRQQAYRAREVGLEIVRGNPAESYNLLPKYSHVLTKANEGTVTHLEQDGDGNFLYYFVAFGSSIKGFMQYIRPVIAADGTHLKGLYRGSMFVATCLDGNNQLYPLVIGVIDSENNDAWEWFMMKLHGVIGDRPELVIISDRYTAIRRAVLKVFHNATHDVCFYHVKDEIVTERRTIAKRMIVRPVSPHQFQVVGGGIKEGLVDLQKKTCSCRVFQLNQLVCAHAIAACLTVRVDFFNLCWDFYTTESLAMAYAQPLEPVSDVADWEVPDEIQEIQVYPPIEAPPPGRRKELRIPSVGEDVNRRTIKCGRCHELGHNRKRCKNLIAST